MENKVESIEPFEFSFEFINDFVSINGHLYDRNANGPRIVSLFIRHRDVYTIAYDYNKEVISLTVSQMESSSFGFYCSEGAYFAFTRAFAKYTNNKF